MKISPQLGFRHPTPKLGIFIHRTIMSCIFGHQRLKRANSVVADVRGWCGRAACRWSSIPAVERASWWWLVGGKRTPLCDEQAEVHHEPAPSGE
jgi:hypothetical protein